MMASLKPNTPQDYIPMSAAMIGICMPSFLLGPLLVLVFGIYLEWLPVSGWGDIPGDKILPSVTLGAAYAAYFARLGRAGMLEVMSQDFIRTARAKGLPEWQVVARHALRGPHGWRSWSFSMLFGGTPRGEVAGRHLRRARSHGR